MTDTLHSNPSASENPRHEGELEELVASLQNGTITPEQFETERRSMGVISGKDVAPEEDLEEQEHSEQAEQEAQAEQRRWSPREPSTTTPEHHGWVKRSRKVLVAIAAVAVAAAGTAIGISAASSARNPSPVATAPTDPSPTPTASEGSPAPSEVSPTPTAPELPFDGERVRIMKKETAPEFYENNGSVPRIQYALSAMHGELDGRSPFGHEMVGQKLATEEQRLPDGKLLSDYNPFKEMSLTANADPQDVLYATMFGEFYAIAHDDPKEGKKMLAAVVADPNSDVFRDIEVELEDKAGIAPNKKTVSSRLYQELKSTIKVVDGKTQLTIITVGGIKSVHEFKPIPGLAESNENTDDDGEEVGVWLLKSRELVKVTIE